MSEQTAVFSKSVSSGRKHYWIDVRKAKTGSLYLLIKEKTEGDEKTKPESRTILVFNNAIKEFTEAFNEAAAKIPPAEKKPRQAVAF